MVESATQWFWQDPNFHSTAKLVGGIGKHTHTVHLQSPGGIAVVVGPEGALDKHNRYKQSCTCSSQATNTLHPVLDNSKAESCACCAVVDRARVLLLCAGLLWTSLELLSDWLATPYFVKLLQGNPKLAGQPEKQRRTAVQMCPRLVCFVHNALQVRMVGRQCSCGQLG